VVGAQRFLQRLWRLVIDEHTGDLLVGDGSPDQPTERLLHVTVDAVRRDYEQLSYHTAIAKLITLTNHLIKTGGVASRSVVEPLVLMTAPLAPHVCEELWQRLGHDSSLARHPFPEADPALFTVDTVDYPIQLKGKVRARIQVSADADPATVEAAALADERVIALLAGAHPRKVVVVPGRMVSIVV
jgi:leucyl-tRNA synthetase